MRHRASVFSYFITIATAVTACLFLLASGPTHADDTPIPLLSTWESNMTTFGRQICNKLAPGAEDWALQADESTMMANGSTIKLPLIPGIQRGSTAPAWRKGSIEMAMPYLTMEKLPAG